MEHRETDTVWGLDIGGTKCALIIGDKSGRVIGRWQVETAAWAGDWRALVDTLLSCPGAETPPPLAIGISCGGPLDSRRGRILSPPNLPGWDDVPITDYITSKTGVPSFVQNDANACALAEWRYGAGQGCRNMIFLTFGTGMGAGLILDGRLYSGTCDMAGEVGHIRLAEDGPEGFHKNGSFEGFCSGGGIARLALLRTGKARSARELCFLADEGDPQAQEILQESARYLGRGLALLLDILNPERIIIGSIFARAQRWFAQEAMAVIRQEALPYTRNCCQILPAQLGDRIGDVAALTVGFAGLEEISHDRQ